MSQLWLPFRDRISVRHKWMKLLVILSMLGAVSLQLNYAIGPSLPLEFEDQLEQRDPWKVVLRIDPEQIRLVRVERQVYANGKRVLTEPIEPYIERPAQDRQETRAVLPLRDKNIEGLASGAYAQKIVVEGRWLTAGANKPLYLQRWFYFVVKEGYLQAIDLDHYSSLVDQADVTIDSAGRQALVHRGLDIKTAVPLPQTKASFAVPVGQLGGAVQERPPRDVKGAAQQVDRSEINEK
jgi:hypothetical protein